MLFINAISCKDYVTSVVRSGALVHDTGTGKLKH